MLSPVHASNPKIDERFQFGRWVNSAKSLDYVRTQTYNFAAPSGPRKVAANRKRRIPVSVMEGCKRIQRVGQGAFIVGVVFAVIILVASFWRSLLQPVAGVFEILMPFSMLFFVFGLLVWLAGWIVEGFAKDRGQTS